MVFEIKAILSEILMNGNNLYSVPDGKQICRSNFAKQGTIKTKGHKVQNSKYQIYRLIF
jgi:hypothetical protein